MWLTIDRSLEQSLMRQIYEQIRDKILKGAIPEGQKLPSTRKLAAELGVSRNITIEVYEQLIAEGYLETFKGAGTYVKRGSFLKSYMTVPQTTLPPSPIIPSPPKETIYDFSSGIPDLSSFPRNRFAKIFKESILDAADSYFDYGSYTGIPELKDALATILLKTKGINCLPEQIMIIPGSTAALEIAFTGICTPGAPVILEDPVYNGIHHIINQANLAYHPIPVDDQGIITDLLPDKPAPGLIHVIPSHQFPTGSILSITRRIQLLHYAQSHGIYIVENDYDSEFRYTGSPINSLYLLDPNTVIHIGTFSETMYPSLRLGYLVIPPALIDRVTHQIKRRGYMPPPLTQLALATFIQKGYYERHITKMKKQYHKKHDFLATQLKKYFGNTITIAGGTTGLFLTAQFDDITFSDHVMQRLYNNNIKISRVSEHAVLDNTNDKTLIFGFGNMPIELINEAVITLHRILKKK